jgi:hypothetical protein
MDTFDLKAYLNENRLLQEQSIFEFMDKSKIQQLINKAVVKKDKDEKNVKESLSATAIIAMPVLLEMAGDLINTIYQKVGMSKKDSAKLKAIKKKQKQIADKANLGIKIFGVRLRALDFLKNDSPEEKKAKQEIEALDKKIDDEFNTSVGNFLIKGGHELHKSYVTPILLFLGGIAVFAPKDSRLKSLDFRKKVANIVYAGAMLGVAGYGIYHSLSHLTGVKEAATAMIELAEEGASVVEVVEAGLESANVADALNIGKK